MSNKSWACAIIGIVALLLLAIYVIEGAMFSAWAYKTNEKDVLKHMNLSIIQSGSVPQGQTVSLGTFPEFLQFIELYKPTIIHDVPPIRYVTPFYGQPEIIYFEHDGITYRIGRASCRERV